jgi:1-acyl-sn-glycerol-3-phosphate acyltransferase
MISRDQLRSFSRWVLENLTHIVVTGEENIPPQGGCILATNHLSRLDTPFLFIAIKRNDLFGLVTDKYRHNPLFALFVKVSDSIWINREIADFQAIRAAVAGVKKGALLGIAPEGTRSKSAQMNQAKNGVALLAEKARVPILPVGIWGSDAAMKAILSFHRPTVHISFGKTFMLPEIIRGNHEEMLDRNTDEIMCRIAALLPEQYRGFYRDHPRLQEILTNPS